MDRCLTLILLLVFIGCVFAQHLRMKREQTVPEMSQKCLDCICLATSDCDETPTCRKAGGRNYYYGPYLISWAYWHDGGRPGDKGRSHDFETCLNNKTCAEEAVRGYMRRYGLDCDASGDIDCFDFARMHKLGFGDCGGNAVHNTLYWKKFKICYNC